MAHYPASFCVIINICLAILTISASEPTESPTQQPTIAPEDSNQSTDKETTTKEIIFYICGIVIVILLVVIGILLWIIYKYGNNKKERNSTIPNDDTTFVHVSNDEPIGNSPISPTLVSNSVTHVSNQLQLTNLINSSNMQQDHGINHYGINSITFNSEQNNVILNDINNHKQVHHVNVIVPNDDAEADLPSSSSNDSNDDESSSFSMNDKNNAKVDDMDTPKNDITTSIGTLNTTRQPNNDIVGLHTASKSNKNYNNNNNIMNVNAFKTPTSGGTTKGITKLPQPKTPGHWM